MTDRIKYLISSFFIHSIWISLVLLVLFSMLDTEEYSGKWYESLLIHFYLWPFVLFGKLVVVLAVRRGGWQALSPALLLLNQSILIFVFFIISILASWNAMNSVIATAIFVCAQTPMVLYYHIFRNWALKKGEINRIDN